MSSKVCIFVVTLVAVSFCDLLVLPLNLPLSLDSVSQKAILELTKEAFTQSSAGEVTFLDEVISCENDSCAYFYAAEHDRNQVAYFRTHVLGKKIIVRSYLLDVKKQGVVSSGSGEAIGIEDLDSAIYSSVSALFASKKEESLYNSVAFGTAFGYGFPVRETSYPNRSDDGNSYKQIIYLDFLTSFDINDNHQLSLELHTALGVAYGIHANLTRKLFDGPVYPFLGLGIGLDYVSDQGHELERDTRMSGFAFNGQFGVTTTNDSPLSALLRTGYKLVFNHRYDDTLFVQFGVIIRSRRPNWSLY